MKIKTFILSYYKINYNNTSAVTYFLILNQLKTTHLY